jgi:hypothetical protein
MQFSPRKVQDLPCFIQPDYARAAYSTHAHGGEPFGPTHALFQPPAYPSSADYTNSTGEKNRE